MRLEEHPYRKKFLATIIGPVSIDDPYFEGTYLLKIEPGAAEKLSTYCSTLSSTTSTGPS